MTVTRGSAGWLLNYIQMGYFSQVCGIWREHTASLISAVLEEVMSTTALLDPKLPWFPPHSFFINEYKQRVCRKLRSHEYSGQRIVRILPEGEPFATISHGNLGVYCQQTVVCKTCFTK